MAAIAFFRRIIVSPRDQAHPAGRAALWTLVVLALATLLAPFIGDRGQVLLAVCLIGGAVAGVCFALEAAVLWSALAWSLATAAAGARLVFLGLHDEPDLLQILLFTATVQAAALVVLTAPVWLASWRARLAGLVALAGSALVIILILTPLTVEDTGQSTLVAMLDLLALPLAVLARRLSFSGRPPGLS